MMATNLMPFLNSSEMSISFAFYRVFHCPDHLLRQGCHEEFPYTWFQMAIDLFVVDCGIAFLLLSGSGPLHVKEADVLRIWYRHAHALDWWGALESIGKSAGTLPVVRRCYCWLACQQHLCLAFEVASHLMLEFICEHNALFSTKIYILLKMVNKTVADQFCYVTFDVNHSGVDVVDIVPMGTEEQVVRVLLTPRGEGLVCLMSPSQISLVTTIK